MGSAFVPGIGLPVESGAERLRDELCCDFGVTNIDFEVLRADPLVFGPWLPAAVAAAAAATAAATVAPVEVPARVYPAAASMFARSNSEPSEMTDAALESGPMPMPNLLP